MVLFSILFWFFVLVTLVVTIWSIVDYDLRALRIPGIIATVVFVVIAWFFQTHTIVPTQTVAVTRSSFGQQLSPPLESGLQSKPFFGSVHAFPSAESTEYCKTYNPSLKGSYGITVDLCYYINTSNVNWQQEIQRTGSLESDFIWNVWSNSVVSDVAESTKSYTPEQLSENRAQVENEVFENVFPWFNERGIPLSRVSLVNWDFTSEVVAATFDESIVSQRKITEQAALFEAAKVARERQLYEADTALIVAAAQQEMLNDLGFTGQDAINYLWIALYKEQETAPQMVIIPSGADAAISVGP